MAALPPPIPWSAPSQPWAVGPAGGFAAGGLGWQPMGGQPQFLGAQAPFFGAAPVGAPTWTPPWLAEPAGGAAGFGGAAVGNAFGGVEAPMAAAPSVAAPIGAGPATSAAGFHSAAPEPVAVGRASFAGEDDRERKRRQQVEMQRALAAQVEERKARREHEKRRLQEEEQREDDRIRQANALPGDKDRSNAAAFAMQGSTPSHMAAQGMLQQTGMGTPLGAQASIAGASRSPAAVAFTAQHDAGAAEKERKRLQQEEWQRELCRQAEDKRLQKQEEERRRKEEEARDDARLRRQLEEQDRLDQERDAKQKAKEKEAAQQRQPESSAAEEPEVERRRELRQTRERMRETGAEMGRTRERLRETGGKTRERFRDSVSSPEAKHDLRKTRERMRSSRAGRRRPRTVGQDGATESPQRQRRSMNAHSPMPMPYTNGPAGRCLASPQVGAPMPSEFSAGWQQSTAAPPWSAAGISAVTPWRQSASPLGAFPRGAPSDLSLGMKGFVEKQMQLASEMQKQVDELRRQRDEAKEDAIRARESAIRERSQQLHQIQSSLLDQLEVGARNTGTSMAVGSAAGARRATSLDWRPEVSSLAEEQPLERSMACESKFVDLSEMPLLNSIASRPPLPKDFALAARPGQAEQSADASLRAVSHLLEGAAVAMAASGGAAVGAPAAAGGTLAGTSRLLLQAELGLGADIKRPESSLACNTRKPLACIADPLPGPLKGIVPVAASTLATEGVYEAPAQPERLRTADSIAVASCLDEGTAQEFCRALSQANGLDPSLRDDIVQLLGQSARSMSAAGYAPVAARAAASPEDATIVEALRTEAESECRAMSAGSGQGRRKPGRRISEERRARSAAAAERSAKQAESSAASRPRPESVAGSRASRPLLVDENDSLARLLVENKGSQVGSRVTSPAGYGARPMHPPPLPERGIF
eukprot:TRINITY_DN47704_c0_g1_i1.p1 TRINITY_DN47704_c0_g1~~TRINITY_DN47704_c0_g1_i1.p1  ORF type:complete len:933 (-),score=207.43 TRINITY_DN47704_c0_g1_i1:350-3148(-)